MKEYNESNTLHKLAELIALGDLEKSNQLITLCEKFQGLFSVNINGLVNGKTLLHIAVENNQLDAFLFLIGHKDFSIQTCLNAFQGDEQHEKINRYSSIYINVLQTYLLNEELNSFNLWIEVLANNNNVIKFNLDAYHHNKTLLHYTIDYDMPEQLDKLLALGCDINKATKDGALTPLKRALMLKNKHLSLKLLQHDALQLMPDVVAAHAKTELMYAARAGFPDILNQLLKKGLPVNLISASGCTALSSAAKAGDLDIAKHLIKHPNCNVMLGEPSPLQHAIKNKQVEIIELLLLHGAGIFQNLPESFSQLQVDASYCYVEGMTINHAPISHDMPGFFKAYLTTEEVKTHLKDRQSMKLSYQTHSAFLLPSQRIKQCFLHLQTLPDHQLNHLFISAMDQFFGLDLVPSLSSMVLQYVRQNQLDAEQDLRKALPPHMTDLLFERNFPLETAHNVVVQRLDELRQFLEYVHLKQGQEEDQIAHFRKLSARLSKIYTAPVWASMILTIPGSMLTSSSLMSGPRAANSTALLITGILILSLVPILLLASVICYRASRSYHDRITNTPNALDDVRIVTALNQLAQLMTSESLPENIRDLIETLNSEQDLPFDRLENSLSDIIVYYQTQALPAIESDTSRTPYTSYQNQSFFFTPTQRPSFFDQSPPPLLMGSREADEIEFEVIIDNANEGNNNNLPAGHYDAPRDQSANESPETMTEKTPLLFHH